MDAIDMIMDEENAENIVMYNEQGEAMEFEQIAVVPIEGNVFVILKPVGDVEGIGEDEALAFVIEEIDGEECLSVVEDDDMVNRVFDEYFEMLREAGIDV